MASTLTAAFRALGHTCDAQPTRDAYPTYGRRSAGIPGVPGAFGCKKCAKDAAKRGHLALSAHAKHLATLPVVATSFAQTILATPRTVTPATIAAYEAARERKAA